MRPALAVALVLFCSTARASTAHLLDFAGDAPRMHLLDSTEGQLNPIQHAKTDLFLLGLGLAVGGLIIGGAGFAILYYCQEGQACHSDTNTTIGWALAAPGVLPLAAGLIIIYLFTGGRRYTSLEPSESSQRWVLTAAPLRGGGGMIGGAFSF